MAQTTNYGLALPEETDYYSIHVFNANAEAIDAQMKANEEETSRKAAKTVTLTCTLPASGWSGAAPYSQTVSVSGRIHRRNCRYTGMDGLRRNY